MNSEQKRMVLRCTCCGAPAPAYAQWSNQDIGYGICSRCWSMKVQRYGEDKAQWQHGLPGTHHSIKDEVSNGQEAS